MHLVQIPPDAVINGESPLQTMWPLIAPLLQRAVDHSEGKTTLKETVGDLMAKRKQLWVIIGDDKKILSAAVSMLQSFESGLVLATIILLGGEGGNLDEILGLRSQFEVWAKTEGCNRVDMYLRKGWARKLPDYRLVAYVMSKEI